MSNNTIPLNTPNLVFQYMPPMLLIYGRNGIGKSFFASQFKNPVFLDLDKNIYELPVESNRSFGVEIESFIDVIDFLNRLINEDHSYETIVIDSLSSLERLVEKHIVLMNNSNPKKNPVKSLADFQYGQGHQMMMPLWEQFLSKMMILRTKKKLNVLMLAHYKEKRDPNLTGDAYQQYQIDLYEKAAKLLVNSCSAVLLADYKVEVLHYKEKFGQDVPKAKGSERRLFTNEGVRFMAKNTYGMPYDIPMSYDVLADYVREHFLKLKETFNNSSTKGN
jgi:hypothetical protein